MSKEELLFSHAMNGILAEVTSAIREGVDVNCTPREQGWNGCTPLIAACNYDRKDVVSYLLRVPGIDVNACDNNGNTALHFACFDGYEDCVRSLLCCEGIEASLDKKNIDPLRGTQSNTPLDNARERGHTKVVALLEAFKADPRAWRANPEKVELAAAATAAEEEAKAKEATATAAFARVSKLERVLAIKTIQVARIMAERGRLSDSLKDAQNSNALLQEAKSAAEAALLELEREAVEQRIQASTDASTHLDVQADNIGVIARRLVVSDDALPPVQRPLSVQIHGDMEAQHLLLLASLMLSEPLLRRVNASDPSAWTDAVFQALERMPNHGFGDVLTVPSVQWRPEFAALLLGVLQQHRTIRTVRVPDVNVASAETAAMMDALVGCVLPADSDAPSLIVDDMLQGAFEEAALRWCASNESLLTSVTVQLRVMTSSAAASLCRILERHSGLQELHVHLCGNFMDEWSAIEPFVRAHRHLRAFSVSNADGEKIDHEFLPPLRTPVCLQLIENGDMKEIESLQYPEAVATLQDARDSLGNSAFHIAARTGNEEVASWLLEHVPELDVDAKNDAGDAPVHVAVHNKQWGILAWMLRNYFNCNAVDAKGRSGLWLCASIAQADSVELFLRAMAIDQADSEGVLALFAAVRASSLACVQQLMGVFRGWSAQDMHGNTLLHVALEAADDELVKYVFEKAAEVGRKSGDWCDPGLVNAAGVAVSSMPLSGLRRRIVSAYVRLFDAEQRCTSPSKS